MRRIIECVPNFSEGRNRETIEAIAGAIEKSGGVRILDIDPGEATNRTVVTFVGEPESVVEAAFCGVKRASELIDMRHHHGAHPRSGATDVLPLIPVSGITLEECAGLARKLAERIWTELGIPCYCYEAAAFRPERKDLAVCRAGEYEALPEKMADPDKAPDSRYIHRGRFNWDLAEKISDRTSVQGRIFSGLEALEKIRRTEAVFNADAEVYTKDYDDTSVLWVVRRAEGEELHAVFNFSDEGRKIWVPEKAEYTDLVTGVREEVETVDLSGWDFVWMKRG